jgi:hypothetical protein
MRCRTPEVVRREVAEMIESVTSWDLTYPRKAYYLCKTTQEVKDKE